MKTCHFKGNDSEAKPYRLCIGIVLKDFILDSSKKKKTELKGDTKAFSVHYDSININDILNMDRFLMKET